MQVAVVEDYTNLRERQAFFVVSIPGETAWVKEVRFYILVFELPLMLSLAEARRRDLWE